MDFFVEYKPYVTGSLFTAITGLTIWLIQRFIQRDRLKLRYEISASKTFPSGTKTGRAYTITLKNVGNRPVLNCSYHVQFKEQHIDAHKFSEERLISALTCTEKEIECTVPLLNPKERLDLSVTCVGEEGMINPVFTARAPGVNAKAFSNAKALLIGWSIIILAGIGITYLPSKEDNGPTKQDEIFVILNESGLTKFFPEIMPANSDDLSYKNTAYALFSQALTDTANQGRYLTALEKLGAVEAMNDNSRATIFYLLGKAEQYRNKGSKASEFFAKSATADEETYNYLMKHDASYDVLELIKDQDQVESDTLKPSFR